MAAFLFEYVTLDRGAVAPGAETNLTVALTGAWQDVSGVREGEYGITIPGKQVDGVTNTTGTVQVVLRFNNDKSATYVKTITSDLIPVDNVNGVVRSIHFMTDGLQYMQAVITPSLNAGHVVAGPAIGVNSINRAH